MMPEAFSYRSLMRQSMFGPGIALRSIVPPSMVLRSIDKSRAFS